MKIKKIFISIIITTLVFIVIYYLYIENDNKKVENKKEVVVKNDIENNKNYWEENYCLLDKPERLVKNAINRVSNYIFTYIDDSLIESFLLKGKRVYVKQTTCDYYLIEIWVPYDDKIEDNYDNSLLHSILNRVKGIFEDDITFKRLLSSFGDYEEKVIFNYKNYYEECKFDGKTCLESFGVYEDIVNKQGYIIFWYKDSSN